MTDAFEHLVLLALGPIAVLILWLLERWRRQPVRIVVADLRLFEPTPEVEADARARRRRLDARFVCQALAALLLAAAAAGPLGPRPPAGPLLVDLVVDRGVTSGVVEADGATRLEHHRRHLRRALASLRADDRARVHLVPGAPGATPLSPDEARAVLDHAAPTASAADLEAALARIGPGVVAPDAEHGRPPLLVATDRELRAVPAGALVARSGGARADRALLALARGDDGALHATVASYDAAGPARVALRARAADGVERSAEREVALPARGLARASWRADEGFPAGAVEAEAWLVGEDALPTDDRAFAVLAPPARRVALVGEPGPAVRRALAAVEGTSVVDLPGAVLDADPSIGARFDVVVLVLPRTPDVLPRTAVVVIPPAGARGATLPGGRVEPGTPHRAFEHTLHELATPFHVRELQKVDLGLSRLEPLLRVGARDLVALRGAGRELLVVIAAPLLPEVTDWPTHDSFPLFWAELLALASPREQAELRAHPAGVPARTPLGTTVVPLFVERLAIDDRAWLGTVAAPPDALLEPVASSAFPEDLRAVFEASRLPGARASWRAPLALLALVLLLASWWPWTPAPVPGAAARRAEPLRRASA